MEQPCERRFGRVRCSSNSADSWAGLVKGTASELTCLPLAIAQAAAYLNMNGTSIAKYLQLVRNMEHAIVGLMNRELRDDRRYKGSVNAVTMTWVVSFGQIRARDAAACPTQQRRRFATWQTGSRPTTARTAPTGLYLAHAILYHAAEDLMPIVSCSPCALLSDGSCSYA